MVDCIIGIVIALWCFGIGYLSGSLRSDIRAQEAEDLRESLWKDMMFSLTKKIKELDTENQMLRDALDNKDMEGRG